MRRGACAVIGLTLLWLLDAVAQGAGRSSIEAGEAIYLRGTLISGASLQGIREVGSTASRSSALACVNCHRRSGLGSTEGSITIPPIAGRYLFHVRTATSADAALPYVESARANRDPYTDDTLARAIREGLDSEGRPLGYLMPRFTLSDADLAALTAYLRTLGERPVPGVTDSVLHFATIITPDADPVKRAGVLDVLRRYFADKNAFPFGPSPRMRSSGKTLFSKSMYMANRRWQLHVWELTGPAALWPAQLRQHLTDEPVLAVISGLGGSQWTPIYAFCEQERLPCLFPNVEVPVQDERDFYSLFFSKGVLLEAQLIAGRISAGDGNRAGAVAQIYRTGDSGEAAARELAGILRPLGFTVRGHALKANDSADAVRAAVRDAAANDSLVLWLRAGDLAALDQPPDSHTAVFMSGLLGGLERAPLPSEWRHRTRMAYPLDLPEQRRVRVDYPLKWFEIRHVPVVAEQTQVDTYLACGLLAETLNHMADNVGREYLIERAEELLEHRVMTGFYPRLALAEGQRFASKGGYLVQFADAQGTRLLAAQGWTVP